MNIFKNKFIKYAEKRPVFYENRLSHVWSLDSLSFYLTAIQ